MRISSLLIVAAVAVSSLAATSAEKALKMKEQELAVLKGYVEEQRDSLQLETTARYAVKQRFMEQREADKEEFDRMREQQERAAGLLSQAKEEVLAQEQQLADERKTTQGKQEEWTGVRATLDELLQKEASTVSEAFPLDRALRQADLEEVRRVYASNRDPAASSRSFARYKSRYITSSGRLTVSRERVLPDEGAAVNLALARFGSVLGYGVDTAGAAYIIRQTGRLGSERFAIEKIGSLELSRMVAEEMPRWLTAGRPYGIVPIDVMQNEQSKLLIAGTTRTWWESTYHSLKQGGMIMIPLLLLPFWVLYLGVRKASQIYGRKMRFGSHYRKVMSCVDKSDYAGALEFVKNRKGAMARILQTCLEYRDRDRRGCERAVREIIYHEMPVINRGINTVAVIAGAAPLLGLLGTISGMITLFAAVTSYGTGDPKFLAGGISEALITAKTGLAIAIPALFLHDWLRGSKERLLAEVEEYSAHTMNRFWPEG